MFLVPDVFAGTQFSKLDALESGRGEAVAMLPAGGVVYRLGSCVMTSPCD